MRAVRSTWTDDRPAGDATGEVYLESVRRLGVLRQRMLACAQPEELLARGADEATAACGFSRGVILAVSDRLLTAAQIGVLSSDASDQLRRRVLRTPVPIEPGTDEGDLLASWPEQEAQGPGGCRRQPSALAEALGLTHYAFGVLAPDRRPLALLIVDRRTPPVTAMDRAIVGAYASAIASALERTVRWVRAAELSREIQNQTVSIRALVREAIDAPIALPSYWGRDVVFPGAFSAELTPVAQRETPLSERELEVMALLVKGRSNREIARELVLSPDAVKSRIRTILRKLGASNRVDAVSRYLQP